MDVLSVLMGFRVHWRRREYIITACKKLKKNVIRQNSRWMTYVEKRSRKRYFEKVIFTQEDEESSMSA